MILTLGTLDHYCTEAEDQCVGEVLSSNGTVHFIRKHVLRDGNRVVRTFGTPEEALDWAKRAGFTVQ